jgi:histone H2B
MVTSEGTASKSPWVPGTTEQTANMAKKPIQKKSKKVAKKGGRRKKGKRSYKTYIGRVLKGLKGNFRISKKAMAICNSFAADLFDRVASEAGGLTKHAGTKTLSSKAVQAACRLQLPGELAKHAMSEGAKAVARASS